MIEIVTPIWHLFIEWLPLLNVNHCGGKLYERNTFNSLAFPDVLMVTCKLRVNRCGLVFFDCLQEFGRNVRRECYVGYYPEIAEICALFFTKIYAPVYSICQRPNAGRFAVNKYNG